jgi:predicted phage gp36 major capsid-like protein
MTALNQAPETKATGEVAAIYDDLRYTLEAYRATNDERLAELETRMGGDVLTGEKLARLDDALDETRRRLDRLSLDRSRPALGASEERDPAVAEHKAAFAAYVRHGETTGLKRLEAKALSAGSGPDGGYLAPSTVEGEILRRLANVSPIRSIATVRTISSGTYKKAFSTTGPASGWVAETAARPQTGTPCWPSSPSRRWNSTPCRRRRRPCSTTPSSTSTSGSPRRSRAPSPSRRARLRHRRRRRQAQGLPRLSQVADASWSWGNIGTLKTGVAGAFAASNPSDILVDLVYALKAGYRQNASFVMNRKTQAWCASSRTRPATISGSRRPAAGAQATLLGFPVIEAEDMPNIATDSVSIASATSGAAIWSSTGRACASCAIPIPPSRYVLFYTTKRVGGGVQDFAAIKGLKFSA